MFCRKKPVEELTELDELNLELKKAIADTNGKNMESYAVVIDIQNKIRKIRNG